jgi:hypothetical protein
MLLTGHYVTVKQMFTQLNSLPEADSVTCSKYSHVIFTCTDVL